MFYLFGTKLLQFSAKKIAYQGTKIPLVCSYLNYKCNLERTSNSPHSSRPVGRVLWDEFYEVVILHVTPLCSQLHILLKDGECVCRTSENCKSLVLQDKKNVQY